MKRSIAILLAVAAPAVWAQDEYPLWEGQPPFSKPNTLEETVVEAWGVPCVVDVTEPTLTVHAGRGQVAAQAVIIFPGGGYEKESFQAEGHEIAKDLASQGITAAVLKYRLPLQAASDQPHLLPEADARRSMILMRSMADTYGFNASLVGVMGFSAGGHLATTLSVLPPADERERPDFSLLVYPAITLSGENQSWLEETLFHRSMTSQERDRYSLVDQVSSVTPPAFLAHAYDDDVVPIAESQTYAAALVAAGQEVEVHFFARGGHGFSSGRSEDGTGQWLELAADWILRQPASPIPICWRLASSMLATRVTRLSPRLPWQCRRETSPTGTRSWQGKPTRVCSLLRHRLATTIAINRFTVHPGAFYMLL